MQLSKEKLVDIVGELDMKMKYYVHKQTGELVSFPDDLLWDIYDDDAEIWQPLIDRVNNHPADFIENERMHSKQYFKIMEEYATGGKENGCETKLLRHGMVKNHLHISLPSFTKQMTIIKKHGLLSGRKI